MSNKDKTYKWYALRTIPHKERYVCKELDNRNIENYLPIYKKLVKRDRTKEKILISSYVFVRASYKEIYKLAYIPGSKGLLLYNAVPAVVLDSEIELLQIVCSEMDFHPEINNLAAGQKIKIINGTLKGYTARICECCNKKAGIEILNSSLTIWINIKDLIYEYIK